jgi:two-component system chemotaxis response regulator CheY
MKILLADDDADYRQSLKEIPEDGGHVVTTAADGELAINTYRENTGVDFVVTDFNMPNKNGLAVIQEIRNIQPKARIWLVSNAMDDEIKGAALEAGAEQAIWKIEITTELRKWGIIG